MESKRETNFPSTAIDNSLNGDWTVVLPRRGRNQSESPRIRTQLQQQLWAPTDLAVDLVGGLELRNKMNISLKKVESSEFYHKLVNQIDSPPISDCLKKVLGPEVKMQMVIYGIGSVETYQNPRLQLSLAILMKRRFSWIESIEVFDPILSATECRVLEAFGCSVLSVNEQGRRQALKPTLFFMPHCEAELYNNLLEENWKVDLLNHVALFGNSFETYAQHVGEFKNSTIGDNTGYILASRRFTNEFRIIAASDEYFAAFHDSSWHFFSPVEETELHLINSINIL